MTGMLTANTILQNRYLVVRPLGHGGMGAVYEAVDQRLGARVALKETLVEGEPLLRAFEREARLLSGLRHPALPVVTDYFSEGAGRFLVMQYIPGEDLWTLLKRADQPFPVETVLRWADQVLDALTYLHAHEPPILHRDVKPQNLKLTPDGNVILLDFGLAKGGVLFAETDAKTDVTTGSVAGFTPNYAPLEQVRGLGTDVRSDLYALAATVYTLLTKRIPLDCVTRADAVVNRQPDPLPRADTVNPAVPAPIANLLHAALCLSREDRPPSASDMRAAFAAASGMHAAPVGATAVAGASKTGHAQAVDATVVAGAAGTSSPRGATTMPNTEALAATPPAKRGLGKILLIGGIGLTTVALVAIAIVAIVLLYWPRLSKPVPVNAADASTVQAMPTPLASTVILGRGSGEPRYYALVAGPGTVDLTLDVVASNASIVVEVIDGAKTLRFENGSYSLGVGSKGQNERAMAKVYLERKGTVLLKLGCDYPDNIKAFRLQVAGPIELASRPADAPDPSVLDPLAARFAPRDNPKALETRQLVGRAPREDLYYAFRTGAGDLTFTLSTFGNNAAVSVEVFDGESKRLGFERHGSYFTLGSKGHDERSTARLLVDRDRQLFVRISCDYPDNLNAFRLAIDGPAILEPGVTCAAPGLTAETVAAPFADRDAPVPLPSNELTGRGTEKDLYYTFEVGPGEMSVTLAVAATRGSATVEFFDETHKPIGFTDGSTYFSVATSDGETELGATMALDRRRRVVMRFSNEYASNIESYRLVLSPP